LHCNFST